MAVRSGFPILVTEDLDRLAGFYEAAFAAERTYAFPGGDGDTAYVSLAVGGAALGIGKATGVASVGDRFSLWFYVDDVDESYQRALDAGAVSEHPPTDMPWGERVARVRDPDGFLLNLGAEAA